MKYFERKEKPKQREIISAGNVYSRNKEIKCDITMNKIIFCLTFIVDTITDDPIFLPFCPAMPRNHSNKIISLLKIYDDGRWPCFFK